MAKRSMAWLGLALGVALSGCGGGGGGGTTSVQPSVRVTATPDTLTFTGGQVGVTVEVAGGLPVESTFASPTVSKPFTLTKAAAGQYTGTVTIPSNLTTSSLQYTITVALRPTGSNATVTGSTHVAVGGLEVPTGGGDVVGPPVPDIPAIPGF